MSILPTPDPRPGDTATTSNDLDGIDKAIIAGVIAAVFVTLLTVIVLIAVYLYKHKGSYRTNEDLGNEEASKALQMEDDALSQEKQEYFM
ncbi:hypothetical protein GDO86_018200 [Hymenochirus boettgeri]|uniref:Small cell adhesion glycoprotein n=1 Tax=Hymenochirus boettgeri TaxID=247094 RepID=A0A8T2IGC9_9PIPI|nr:hypothetical protein GDO86_018200 [Hymenochirus boettgeri]